jgi:hypothetical protein
MVPILIETEDIRIARLKTIEIRLGIGMLETLGIRKGKTSIVWTDNTTTEGVMQQKNQTIKQ